MDFRYVAAQGSGFAEAFLAKLAYKLWWLIAETLGIRNRLDFQEQSLATLYKVIYIGTQFSNAMDSCRQVLWDHFSRFYLRCGLPRLFVVLRECSRVADHASKHSKSVITKIRSVTFQNNPKTPSAMPSTIKQLIKNNQIMTNKPTTLLKKALTPESEPTKQQIFDILFVVKQIIGALLGIALAFVGLTGTFALIVYTALSYLVVYFYVMRVLQPEEDTIEAVDLFKEHWMMGFFAFLLPWIVTYNLINF